MSTPPITPSPSHEFGRAIAHAGAYLASKIAELVPSILKEHRATAIRHTFEHQNVLSFQAEAAVNDSHDILMNALSLETLNTLWHNQWCPQATTNLRRKQQNDDWHRPVNDDAAIAIRALSAEPAHIDFAIAALEAVAATAEREPDKVPGDGATGFTARRRRAAALLARVRDSHDDSLLYAGATLPPLHTANREHT